MIMIIKKGSIHSLANIHRHLHHVRTVKQKMLITIAKNECIALHGRR